MLGEQPGFCGLGELPGVHGFPQEGEYFLAPLWASEQIELSLGWDLLNMLNRTCWGIFMHHVEPLSGFPPLLMTPCLSLGRSFDMLGDQGQPRLAPKELGVWRSEE